MNSDKDMSNNFVCEPKVRFRVFRGKILLKSFTVTRFQNTTLLRTVRRIVVLRQNNRL